MENYITDMAIFYVVGLVLGYITNTVLRRIMLIERRKRTQAAIQNLLWGKKG